MVYGLAGIGDETLLLVEFEGGVVDEFFEFGYFMSAGVFVPCFQPVVESVIIGAAAAAATVVSANGCWQWSWVGCFACSGGEVFATETSSYCGPQDTTVIDNCSANHHEHLICCTAVSVSQSVKTMLSIYSSYIVL